MRSSQCSSFKCSTAAGGSAQDELFDDRYLEQVLQQDASLHISSSAEKAKLAGHAGSTGHLVGQLLHEHAWSVLPGLLQKEAQHGARAWKAESLGASSVMLSLSTSSMSPSNSSCGYLVSAGAGKLARCSSAAIP